MPEFRFEPADHKYFLGKQRLYSVTQCLSGLGMYSEEFIKEEDFQRGQAVHQASLYFDLEDLDWDYLPTSEEKLDCAPGDITNRIRAWEKYRKDTGFIPVIMEQAWYHPEWLFAGSADRYGYFPDGDVIVLDIKSGVVQKPTALQLAAYDLIFAANPTWHEEMKAALEKAGLWRGQRMSYLPRYGVQLKTDGTYKTTLFDDMNDGQHFLDAWQIYEWGMQNGLFKRKHDN